MLMRILGITLGLMVAGFVAGGIVGVLVLVCWLGPTGLRELGNEPSIYLLTGIVGGTVGAVLGPVAAWLLMRHVPLGLAVGGTALGTVAGAVLGATLAGPEESIMAGFLGFGAAAVALRSRASARGGAIGGADVPAIARASQDV